jgi:osmotically-inducible protein OsmY
MRLARTIVAVALLLLGGTELSGCTQSGPDAKDRVSTALKNANIRDVDVDYDKDARVVHLKGTVDSRAERARAEDVAEHAVGTSGKVLNEVTVKGVDAKTAGDNDGRIKSQLKDMIDRDAQLKERDVNFEVNNGAVEAKGWVVSAGEKDRVSDMVRSVPGIREFANGLQVRPDKRSATRNQASRAR